MNHALRHLFRDKFYSGISILGLAIALASNIFIFLFVSDELSFDKYHQDTDRIYRVITDFVDEGGNKSSLATTPPVLSGLLQRELPEVEVAARIFPTNGRKTLFRFKERTFYEDRMYDTDSTIFRIFSFPFVKGDPSSALKNPDALIFTESTAKRYFGEDEPIGQVVTVEDQYLGVKELTVTAIVRDVPLNSHFRFDILRPASYMIAPQNVDEAWGFAAFHTYVKLKKGTEVSNFDAKLGPLIQRLNPENKNSYRLQPLKDIHLRSDLQAEIEPNGNFRNVIILVTLAAFIIIVAGINYVNLSTARAVNRAREVGVRKVSGALTGTLIRQFLGESILTSFIALLVALVMMMALLPFFNDLTGKQFTAGLNLDLSLWTSILGFTLLAGILSGIYPALYLSAFSPGRVLRNDFGENKSLGLRSVLVGLQFVTSVTLIICTAVIMRQMNFVQSTRLGFDKEQVIVIPDVYKSTSRAALRQRLLQHPEVISVAASSGMISKNNWSGKMLTLNSKNEVPVTMCNIDTAYLHTLGFTMLQERKVSASDSVAGIVINETAAKQLGLSAPLDEDIYWTRGGRPLKIVGVVRDFHFESLHKKISPFVFQLLDQFLSNVFIRVRSSDLPATLATIESEWKTIAPDRPFQYSFLNQQIETQYRTEMKFKTFFFLAAAVAISVACLGLLGLTALVVKYKTKEIGIRKVLGASTVNIIRVLTKKLVLIVIVSNVIALPIAYLMMEKWLTNFAYHIELMANGWLFLVPAVLVILATLVAMSSLALKSAYANPVKALRSE